MRKPALGFIFVTLFLDILGIGLIIPILPKLIEELSGGNVSAASITYGWLAALYAFMQASGMVNDHLMSCFRHKDLS